MIYDFVLFCGIGILIGLLVAILGFNIHTEAKGRKLVERYHNVVDSNTQWCENGCMYFQEAFQLHKDVDKAIGWLDRTYCVNCPIATSIDYMIAKDLEEQHENKNH